MITNGVRYALEPIVFRSMREAQALPDTLEQDLDRLGLVDLFPEIVNNAAEHGASSTAAQVHVRFMHHRRGCSRRGRGPGYPGDAGP